MLSPYRFSNCNKGYTMVGEVDNGGEYVCAWAERIWDVSVPSSQFCWESKTALKKSLPEK